MRAVLLPFDHALGLRRSCSEDRSLGGGCGVLGLVVGRPWSPLSRLISLRRCWISAWPARQYARFFPSWQLATAWAFSHGFLRWYRGNRVRVVVPRPLGTSSLIARC